MNFSFVRGAVGLKIGYLICGAHCKMKMQGPLFKNHEDFFLVKILLI